jgi:hypothetical protein
MMTSRFSFRFLLSIVLILSIAIVACASDVYALGADSCVGGGGGNGNGGGHAGGGGNLPPHPGNQPIPGPIPSRITHLNQLGKIQTSGC